MNALQQWLDMYDQGGVGNAYVPSPRGAISQLGPVPVRDDNAGARRMMFAERMMGQQQQPQSMNFFDGNQVPQPQMEQRQLATSHHGGIRPQIQNYLAQLMGRNYGA